MDIPHQWTTFLLVLQTLQKLIFLPISVDWLQYVTGFQFVPVLRGRRCTVRVVKGGGNHKIWNIGLFGTGFCQTYEDIWFTTFLWSGILGQHRDKCKSRIPDSSHQSKRGEFLGFQGGTCWERSYLIPSTLDLTSAVVIRYRKYYMWQVLTLKLLRHINDVADELWRTELGNSPNFDHSHTNQKETKTFSQNLLSCPVCTRARSLIRMSPMIIIKWRVSQQYTLVVYLPISVYRSDCLYW